MKKYILFFYSIISLNIFSMDFPEKDLQRYVDNILHMTQEVAYYKKEVKSQNCYAKKACSPRLYELKDRLALYLQKNDQLKNKPLSLVFSHFLEDQKNSIIAMQKDVENIITEHHFERDPTCSVIFWGDEQLFKSLESGIDSYCRSSFNNVDSHSDTYCFKRDSHPIQ